MNIFDLVISNYCDVALILLLPLTFFFAYAAKVLNKSYTPAIVILTSVFCSIFWVIFIPYIAFSYIISKIK